MDLNLIVTDVNGKEYLNKTFNTINRKIEYEVFLDKMNSGAYFYQILSNSRIVQSGKFYYIK